MVLFAKLFDALLLAEFADEQLAIVFGNDISVEALHYCFHPLGYMHHTVVAIKHLDVLANEGVAIHVALALQAQRAPCAKVAPTKIGGANKNLLSLLHHGIVDGDIVAIAINIIDDLLFLWRSQLILQTLKDAIDAGSIHSEGIDDGLDTPNEDACVPEIIVLLDILLSCRQVGLLTELVDTEQLLVA